MFKIRNFIISNGGNLLSYLNKQYVEHNILPVHSKNFFNYPSIANKLKKIIKNQNINIVHVRSRFPAWIYLLATRGLPDYQKPILVSTFHGLYSKPWYSQSMAKSDSIISISNTVKEYIKENYKVSTKNIINIYLNYKSKLTVLGGGEGSGSAINICCRTVSGLSLSLQRIL